MSAILFFIVDGNYQTSFAIKGNIIWSFHL